MSSYWMEDRMGELDQMLEQAKDQRLGLESCLEDALQAVRDMRGLPRESLETLERAVREAYEELIEQVQSAIEQTAACLEELRERRPSWC